MKYLLIFLIASTSYSQQFDYKKDYPALAKQSLDPASPFNYQKLKAQFVDHGENFTKEMALALMIGQTVSENYNPYGDIEIELSYQNAAEWPSDTIYTYAPMYMEVNPVSTSLNYGLWKTYEKDKDIANAAKYEKRFKLLCEAMLSTGDASWGKPCFVVSATDAWALVEFYQGNSIFSKGSGMSENMNRIEILETDKGTRCFIIDHMLFGFREELSKISEPETVIEMDGDGKVKHKKP